MEFGRLVDRVVGVRVAIVGRGDSGGGGGGGGGGCGGGVFVDFATPACSYTGRQRTDAVKTERKRV